MPLTSGPSTPTYTLSWQPYVDTNLVDTGAVTQAAILGHDGRTWASSAGFVVTPAQGRTLANAFSNPGSIRSGFDLDRFHYVTLRADNRSIYGKKVSGGVIAVRTTQAILLGVHNEKIQLGTAANVVEKLADYLIGQGY